MCITAEITKLFWNMSSLWVNHSSKQTWGRGEEETMSERELIEGKKIDFNERRLTLVSFQIFRGGLACCGNSQRGDG